MYLAITGDPGGRHLISSPTVGRHEAAGRHGPAHSYMKYGCTGCVNCYKEIREYWERLRGREKGGRTHEEDKVSAPRRKKPSVPSLAKYWYQ